MSDPVETAQPAGEAPLPVDATLPSAAAPAETGAEAVEDAQPPSDPRPLSSADRMKAKLRAVLDAQPFRGNTVHKSDLLAALDALIDGPD